MFYRRSDGKCVPVCLTRNQTYVESTKENFSDYCEQKGDPTNCKYFMNSTDGMYNICVSDCGKLSAQPVTLKVDGKSVTGYFCQRCSAPTALENGACVATCASHYVEYDYDIEMYRCVDTCPDTKCLKDISDLIPDTMQCI